MIFKPFCHLALGREEYLRRSASVIRRSPTRWKRSSGLAGDGSACAKSGQKVLPGYDNVQTMLSAVTRRGGKVGVCGKCREARGITEAELVEGTHKGSLEEWTTWTVEADKALIF
ncbi:MAG TPA: DsrE family protein [Thermoanaerobaculia bacterium]|nr:DsrE family protein [Thermoanaerobaculia bacterium]